MLSSLENWYIVSTLATVAKDFCIGRVDFFPIVIFNLISPLDILHLPHHVI